MRQNSPLNAVGANKNMPSNTNYRFIKTSILGALATVSFTTQALEFRIGDVDASFNSQLSIGSSWRVEEPSQSLLVAGNNNDGNENYAKGDAFSQVFKGNHELHLRGETHGLLVRGKYWYDFALEENSVPHGHSANGFAENEKLNDSGFNEFSKFSGAQLMDAYLYGLYYAGDSTIDVRLGRQVISWGESTFILGGINAINPVDVNAFRRPGAEIKEGLLPVNLAYANLGISADLSLEAFYQLEFQETVIPGCGTYFAFNDYAPQGCNQVLLTQGFPATADDKFISENGGVINRDVDGNRLAKDENQYGFAMRYFSELMGGTEFGLFYMNVHSRLPLINGVKSSNWQATTGADAASLNAAIQNNKPDTFYYVTYPEDIQLTGLSFATNVGSVALSGEVSHRHNTPLQINATQLLSAGLTGASSSPELAADVAATGNGEDFQGYRLFDVSQAQVTMMQFFDRILGASMYTLVAEAGYTHVHDLDESDSAIKFGRSGIFDGQEEGFVTESSWGYRLRFSGTYRNVIGGASFTPMLAWSHDVEGFAPQPGGAFTEGNQSLGLSLDVNFARYYTFGLAYTQYMEGDYNLSQDRDFASASFTAQF